MIGLEPTGLRPGWHGRVVEVAVVQLDAIGTLVREWWCTLVNPATASARRAAVLEQRAQTVDDRPAGPDHP